MMAFILLFVALVSLPLGATAQLLGVPGMPGPPIIRPIDPIVLVPGISTSWNWNMVIDPDNVSADDPDWAFTVGVDHYDQLIEVLRERGRHVTVAFYDWRRPVAESAQEYLKATIDTVKRQTHSDRVDIIAHSMGGLLARSYIQSDSYEYDVDELIMLGTPQQGSSDVYPVWAGGYIPTTWGIAQRIGFNAYLDLLEQRIDQQGITDATVIHEYIPSVRDLLPTYEFLVPLGKFWALPLSVAYQNETLLALNQPEEVQKLVDRVSVHVIRGKDQLTVNTILVQDASEAEIKQGLWIDGKLFLDNPINSDPDGDNRVLLKSSHVPGDKSMIDERAIVSPHAQLPRFAIDEIFDILGLGSPPTIEFANIEQRQLLMWFDSPLAIEITDPAGNTITAEKLGAIEGAAYDSPPGGGADKPQLFLIPDPIEGQYTIRLTGTGSGEYHVGLTLLDNVQGDQVTRTEGYITANQDIEYSATLSSVGEMLLAPDISLNDIEQFTLSLIRSGQLDKRFIRPMTQFLSAVKRVSQMTDHPRYIDLMDRYLDVLKRIIAGLNRRDTINDELTSTLYSMIDGYGQTIKTASENPSSS